MPPCKFGRARTAFFWFKTRVACQLSNPGESIATCRPDGSQGTSNPSMPSCLLIPAAMEDFGVLKDLKVSEARGITSKMLVSVGSGGIGEVGGIDGIACTVCVMGEPIAYYMLNALPPVPAEPKDFQGLGVLEEWVRLNSARGRRRRGQNP